MSMNYNVSSSTATVPILPLTIIPAVDLNTSAALQQNSDVGISGGLAVQLICLKVRVVTGVDEIVGQRLSHVLGGVRGEERDMGGERGEG